MMTITIYQVDAFTREPFSGNPAGVCILQSPREVGWMQAVAREMALSETAFLYPLGANRFNLRWFTPLKEVRLCGHATLAAAHTLWERGVIERDETIQFDTLSGKLTAARRGDWIDLDFPARFAEPAAPPEGLEQALGVQAEYVAKTENNVYLVEVAHEASVRAMQPDFSALGRLPVRSVVVTARAETAGYDIVSRYFAPAVGINEDPVTGSAHCILAPFWSARLGKSELCAYQASARGGELRISMAGERDARNEPGTRFERVIISGQAVTVIVGQLLEE